MTAHRSAYVFFEKRGWPKRCVCGATWSATTWLLLEYVGVMSDGVDHLELRQCKCDSTISVALVDTRKRRAQNRSPTPNPARRTPKPK